MLQKRTILEIPDIYTANAFLLGGRLIVGAGSETEPVVRLHDLSEEKTEQVKYCPGGMMSIVPVPGKPDSLVSVMGLFPPFLGKKAGLFLHRRGTNRWETHKILDLPFAHRCEFLPGTGSPVLIAASVSKYKENPADWSQPGEIHALNLAKDPSGEYETMIINKNITRNHGMFRGWINGLESLCVSGKEGIFRIGRTADEAWEISSIFEKEVSEMSFIDLDGDGSSELVTIEPFHGSTLNIYKHRDHEWKQMFSSPLSFGHGLSSGIFRGRPIIVTGNRSESLALEIFTPDDLSQGIVNREVIEEGAGPTQTQVFSHEGRDYILSANQKKNEVALYS